MPRLNLLTLRNEKSLTIDQVAGELTRMCHESPERYRIGKVSAASYGGWERGDRDPSSDHICLLADFYGVSTDFLLKRPGARRERTRSVLEELEIERDEWWEIKREAAHDERACAKVFAWIASGKSAEAVWAMSDDEDWKSSKWGDKPDIGTVEAMLMRALDDGAVDIIADKIPQHEELTEALKSQFSFLRQVKVTESSRNQLLARILVGEVAALFFDSIVRPGHKVGMSGGTTLARMAAALRKYPCAGIKLYPFDNGLIPESVDNCANTLIGQIKYFHPAAHIDAYALQYLGFDDSRRPYNFPPNHPSVLRVLDGAQNIDVGFVGFGAVTEAYLPYNPSLATVFASGGTPVDDLIKKDGAVGNTLFQCFKEDGTYINNKLNRRICSVKPRRLRELAESGRSIVGVACGAVKGKAGLGLLNGRYVNNLVIDDKLAAAILEAKKQFDEKQKKQTQ